MSRRLFSKSDPDQTSSSDRKSHSLHSRRRKIHVGSKIGTPSLEDQISRDVHPEENSSDNIRQIHNLVGQRIKDTTVLFVKTSGRFSNPMHSKEFSRKQLDGLIERMSEEFGSKKNARLWFNSPNPELSGKKPIYYIVRGKFEIIENLIDAIESGQPG